MLMLILPRKRSLKRSQKITEYPKPIIYEKEREAATIAPGSSRKAVIVEADPMIKK